MSIRVVFAIAGLEIGGAETMLLRLLSRLDRNKFEPMVISLSDDGPLRGRFEGECERVVSLGLTPRDLPARALWRLAKLLREFRPNIVQGWMYHGNIAGSVARVMGPGDPALVWGIRQSLDDFEYVKPTTAKLIRLGARWSGRPRAIVYNSHVARAQHEALGFSRISGTVIPNGFDISDFSPSAEAGESLRRELGLSGGVRLVGRVGRYHPMKDHLNFIQAAAKVRLRHPECRFVLVGPGMTRENQELAGWLQKAHISDAVCLLGCRQDMPRVNAALDIAVSSSASHEAFPNAIGEAMCCGVPCVVTNVGDSALLVGDTGIVTPPRDSDRLAAGINYMLEVSEHDRRALGAAARARVVAEYSLERFAASFSSLYRSILAGPLEGGHSERKA